MPDYKRNPVTVFANSEDRPLVFERVNEVTIKLTDGSKTRTAASHGQWGGRDDSRALAWIMDIGWLGGRPEWMVRVGDLSYGPVSLAKAKSAAIAIVRGGFDEPVQRIGDPIGRYMALQAEVAEARP